MLWPRLVRLDATLLQLGLGDQPLLEPVHLCKVLLHTAEEMFDFGANLVGQSALGLKKCGLRNELKVLVGLVGLVWRAVEVPE